MKITISDSGRVTIPEKVSMRSFEVADLFGVFEQKINANVKAIIKSGAIRPDISGTVTISGGVIIPLDLGLDMKKAPIGQRDKPLWTPRCGRIDRPAYHPASRFY